MTNRTLSLDVEPVWDSIDHVRRGNEDFLRAHGISQPSIEALSMVTCELMENAVKYGFFDGDVKRIASRCSVERDNVVLEVLSPVRPGDDAAMARLDHMIQWIRGYQDPFQAYLMRLREVSSQAMGTSESGLGLVRIAYEGQSILDFFVDHTSVLNISALHNLPGADRLESQGAR